MSVRTSLIAVCLLLLLLLLSTWANVYYVGSVRTSLVSSSANVDAVNCTKPRPAPADAIKLFVGVLSTSHNTQARQTIRATWGQDAMLHKVMFFVQRPRSDAVFKEVRREATLMGDIVISSEVHEDYYNITYSVLEIFKTAARIGEGITHVVKTDEDCYLRTRLLVPRLEALPKQWLYAGGIMDVASVIRTPGWHSVPYSNWNSDQPVRYAFGVGYVVSVDIAREIAAGAAHMIMAPNNLLIIEDVAVGYWIEHVGRERNTTIQYHALSASISQCAPNLVFIHITSKPQWKAIHCMYDHDGQCC
jgi:hypothetical protein